MQGDETLELKCGEISCQGSRLASHRHTMLSVTSFLHNVFENPGVQGMKPGLKSLPLLPSL